MGKPKGVKMDLNSFMANEDYGSSWADDLEDLPTAPSRDTNAAPSNDAPYGERRSYGRDNEQPSFRRERPVVPIPDKPPYTAYVGNLSFETTETDLELLFRDMSISNIRLIRHDDKPKGFGYIEFSDKASLEDALKYSNESVRGRNIRIDVAEQKQRRDDRPDRGGFRGEEDAKFDSDWRSGAEGPLPPRERNENRDRGDRFGSRDGEGRFGGDRRRSERDNFGGGARRTSDDREGGFNRRERNPPSRSDTGDWSRQPLSESDRPPRRIDTSRTGSAVSSTVTSASVTSPTSISPATNKPNPFGNAKPRDEAEFQRKFEERQRERASQSSSGPVSRENTRNTDSPREDRDKRERKPQRVPSRADEDDLWRRGEKLQDKPRKNTWSKHRDGEKSFDGGDKRANSNKSQEPSPTEAEKSPVAANPYDLLQEDN